MIREVPSIKMSMEQNLEVRNKPLDIWESGDGVGGCVLGEWRWGGRVCSEAEGIVGAKSLRHDCAWHV